MTEKEYLEDLRRLFKKAEEASDMMIKLSKDPNKNTQASAHLEHSNTMIKLIKQKNNAQREFYKRARERANNKNYKDAYFDDDE